MWEESSGRSWLCVCVCWLSFLTPLTAPLQDSSSVERRKPISLNSQRATQRDTEVLHSNFTVISLHRCEGAEGSGRWQPQGEEMGSDSGCIHPILSYLFSPFSSPPVWASSGFLWLAQRHTHTHTETHFPTSGNTHWEVPICFHAISDIHMNTSFCLLLSPCHDCTNTYTQNFSLSAHRVLCGFTISVSPHGLVSLPPQLPERKL